MFFSAVSFFVPLFTSLGATYIYYADKYESFSLGLLCLGVACAVFSLLISSMLPRTLRFFGVFSGFFTLTAFTDNFTVSCITSCALILLFFYLRRKKRCFMIEFDIENTPMWFEHRYKMRLKKALCIVAACATAIFPLVYALAAAFPAQNAIWAHRLYPIDLTEREIPEGEVIPGGEVTVAQIYDPASLLVNSFFDVGGVSPARDSGLQAGDVITHIDSVRAADSDFMNNIADGRSIEVKFLRRNGDAFDEHTAVITPAYSAEEERYLIGIYYYNVSSVTLSTAQTLSFIYPDTGSFAATAHSVHFADDISSAPMILKEGVATGRDESGLTVEAKSTLGNILHLSEYGAFGTLNTEKTETLPLAARKGFNLGRATLLSAFEGGEVKEYSVFITGTYRLEGRDVISLAVTDERLLTAGGITRGMSGSPIIQNGKLIGALSHTMENGRQGYAAFACDMAHEITLMEKGFNNDSSVSDY